MNELRENSAHGEGEGHMSGYPIEYVDKVLKCADVAQKIINSARKSAAGALAERKTCAMSMNRRLSLSGIM